jgi:hypothetical protein
MTFLAPSLLFLGLAAAVPVALHLLQRHPGRRVVFPALRYLRRADRERASRLRLTQLILLALRILAVGLLAAAAARPFLRHGEGAHPPTAVVMVLDNSMASGAVVGDRRALDLLRDAALATVRQSNARDRLWLIRAGETWEPALSGDPESLEKAIRETEPAATGADLPAEVARAARILAAEGGGRVAEIQVLSLLRRGSLVPASGGPSATVGAALEPTGPPVRMLVLAPQPLALHNRGIVGLGLSGGMPPLSGEPGAVSVRIAGSDPAMDSVDLRLVIDGQVRSTARAVPGSGIELRLPAHPEGWLTGRLELDPDQIAADDRRYFVTRVRPPPTVELGAAAPYIAEALGVLGGAGRVRPGVGTGDMVIAPGAAGVEALGRGAGVVVLPPESPLELAATNQRLAAAGIDWRLAPPGPGEARLAAAGTELDPIMADVRLRQVFPLQRAGDAPDTVLLRLQTGEPWAVAGRVGEGRYVLLATPLTADGSTIPTSPAIIPLLDRAIHDWLGATGPTREHRPGDVVTLPPGDSLILPDGSSAPVLAGSSYRLHRPGVYRVMYGDTLAMAYAVNPPAGASDVRPAAVEDLASLVPGLDARTIAVRSWAGAVFHRRIGRDISVHLVLTALLALLIESGLAAAGRGRARAASERRPDSTQVPGAA